MERLPVMEIVLLVGGGGVDGEVALVVPSVVAVVADDWGDTLPLMSYSAMV